MIEASKHHLDQVGESYFEHLAAALGFAVKLAKASLACAIHALVPGVFARAASSSVAELQAKLVMRAAPAGTERSELTSGAGLHQRSQDDRVRIDA